MLELLVSITVLLILISLMLPALHHATRVSAPMVRCSNNLSQIHRALKLYLNENNDLMPKADFSPLSKSHRPRLNITLGRYGGEMRRLWVCPSDYTTRASVSNLNALGSYIYPLGKAPENVQYRIYALPVTFPILADREAFHLARRSFGSTDSPDVNETDRSIGIDMSDWMNPILPSGHNRLLQNGKISIDETAGRSGGRNSGGGKGKGR